MYTLPQELCTLRSHIYISHVPHGCVIIGASLTLARVLLDCYFMSIKTINDRKWIPNLISSCVTQVLFSIWNLPYMVVGSSVSQKACDKVFLNNHIWSLDYQYSTKYATKFSELPYMVIGSSVSRKHVTKYYWMTMIVWSQMMVCKFSSYKEKTSCG